MPIDPMMRRRARTLRYMGPRKGCILASFAEVGAQAALGENTAPYWRARSNRPLLTMRQAALYCCGRKCMIPEDHWAFAQWPEEDSDVDVVCRRRSSSGLESFEFVQLKEVVPDEANSNQTLQVVLDSLATHYSRPSGLTFAIHLNRNAITSLSDLRLPSLPEATLWLFGNGSDPDHDHNSFLIGDILTGGIRCWFTYPRPRSGESPSQWANLLDDSASAF